MFLHVRLEYCFRAFFALSKTFQSRSCLELLRSTSLYIVSFRKIDVSNYDSLTVVGSIMKDVRGPISNNNF